MSILQVTAVYDSVAETYFPPVFVPSKGVGIRSFQDAVLASDTQFAKHPQHFSLFYLGSYDQATAQFKLDKSPSLLLNAWEVKP